MPVKYSKPNRKALSMSFCSSASAVSWVIEEPATRGQRFLRVIKKLVYATFHKPHVPQAASLCVVFLHKPAACGTSFSACQCFAVVQSTDCDFPGRVSLPANPYKAQQELRPPSRSFARPVECKSAACDASLYACQRFLLRKNEWHSRADFALPYSGDYAIFRR